MKKQMPISLLLLLAAIFAMSLGNVLGLYLLMGTVKKDLKDYQARLKSGEIKRYK